MARRTNFVEVTKSVEKKEYFSSKYAFNKVTNLTLGGDAYCIFLKPENYIFENMIHTLKAKSKGKHGFKGIYDTGIICKRYDVEGNRSDEAPLCCQLANNESYKNIISYTKTKVYIPVLILANSEKNEKMKKIPPQKVSIKSWEFAYIEMSRATFKKDIFDIIAETMKNAGDVDYDMDGEDLQLLVLERLKKTLIKVTGVASTSPTITGTMKQYSFLPFDKTPSIGKETNEYEDIVNFENNQDLVNEAVTFLETMEKEVDSLVKDWTDDELNQYIVEEEERKENVAEYNKAKAQERELEEEVSFSSQTTEAQETEMTFEDDDFEWADDGSDFIED